MPSLAALEAYNQYLTQYSSPTSKNKEDLHDKKKLRDVYGSIQKKNSVSPLYLNEPSSDEVLNALVLKDEVYSYHQDIAKLYVNNPSDPFMQKFPYSNNEEIATVQITNDESEVSLPQSVNIEIESFASPQTNIGSFLDSDSLVALNNGNYSFDLLSKKLNFELQFNIYDDDTNEELQNRITRLINKSNLGVHAAVLKDNESSALCVVSDALGKPLKGDLHFAISDDNTSQTAGVVNYLGLNSKIAAPQNAKINYAGEEAESYDNTFTLFEKYQLTLVHGETSQSDLPVQIEIGFYPDVESLTKNLNGFVDGYNDLRSELQQTGSTTVLRELNHLMSNNEEALSEFGISKNEDKTLTFTQPENWNEESPQISDTSKLTSIGNKVLKTLQDVSIDPMVHINRKVGVYQNPVASKTLNRPYINNYSGMLYNKDV